MNATKPLQNDPSCMYHPSETVPKIAQERVKSAIIACARIKIDATKRVKLEVRRMKTRQIER